MKPKYVWEIKAADLSLSAVHTAGLGHIKGKGIALRFPRIVRIIAAANLKDCMNSDQIIKLYESQHSLN